MDRRSFLKFLGIGAATAAVAPEVLAHSPKYTMGVDVSAGADKTVTVVKSGILEHVGPTGRFMFVQVAPNTMPFRVGDLVRYKVNKKGEMIAYRTNDWKNTRDGFGVAICNAPPGNYVFIKINGPDLRVVRLADGSLKAL